MGAQISRQIQVVVEEQQLQSLEESRGTLFPGSNYRHQNHKEWMATLKLDEITARDVVWPGTHNSATNRIGIPFFTRPFFQCQKYSIYEQLVMGVRVLDIRVQQDRRVCHSVLCSYSVDFVISDIKRFLDETSLEFLLVEFRTEYKWFDPLQFDEYLISQLGEYLIPQDEQNLDKPLRELLPGRVFCVWKPSIAPLPELGSPLWGSDHLLDDWIDTDLPLTKFRSNLECLKKQAPNATRSYFYRVENTATPQHSGPIWCVYPVTNRIRGYARLFLAETFRLGLEDRIQIFSEDFITKDFVDACIGVTVTRIRVAIAHAKQLMGAGVPPGDIGIITPYSAQVGILKGMRSDDKTLIDVEISTVDGFQGREKEAIIISMVRSNDKHEVGFLSDNRRMNVAVTRARRQCCIVCNVETVGKDEFLKRLVDHFEANGEYLSAMEYS